MGAIRSRSFLFGYDTDILLFQQVFLPTQAKYFVNAIISRSGFINHYGGSVQNSLQLIHGRFSLADVDARPGNGGIFYTGV
ncbi:hypothetical protein VspSTUT11_38460 [Vibrio sp. STUT-A11]|nr:hypothetical protein VspSTUT11_38460 [Vibrio sp. STUT-A11]